MKHDVILSYGKTLNPTWNVQFKPHRTEYFKKFKKDKNGRLYRDDVNPTAGGARTIYLDELKDRMNYQRCYAEILDADPSVGNLKLTGEAMMDIQEPEEAIKYYE